MFKRLRAKVRRIRTTEWRKKTRGEKIVTVVLDLLKVAAIVAAVLAVLGFAFAIFMGFVIASCIVNAIIGGLDYVHYDEYYVRFRK